MINASVSAILGIAFAVLGTGTVFLMFHCWGYPFDKATRKSDAPRGLMLLHRTMGFAFIALQRVQGEIPDASRAVSELDDPLAQR